MKKLQWIGTETEFLEFVMFVDTLMYELSQKFDYIQYPTSSETAAFLQRFIDVDLRPHHSFFDLKMNGRPIGFLFHGLLRLKKFMEKKCSGLKTT